MKSRASTATAVCFGLVLSACANDPHFNRAAAEAHASAGSIDRAAVIEQMTEQSAVGKVSWYGPGFAGRPTANGEIYDPSGLTMAHRTLPLGTWVEVRNPANDRSVIVRVNDRGPYIDGRIADLSRGAAERIGMVDDGVIRAELRVLARRDEPRRQRTGS